MLSLQTICGRLMENNQIIAKYIWHIITLDPYIPMSWGIDTDSMIASDDSLEFTVNGFLHTGSVRITYIDGADLFQVCLYGEDGTLKETVNDIYFDNLTETIDRLVENTGEDYGSRVLESLTQSAV